MKHINPRQRKVAAAVFAALLALALLYGVIAAIPSGPSITYISNQTSAVSGIPTQDTYGDSRGGRIVTINLIARQQNSHYKAYVGNVTGAYVLEDAANYSIYEWSVATIAGEVYTTRASSSITWSSVRCANVTNIAAEMAQMQHNTTNTPDDSINSTFNDDTLNHWGFFAGSSEIGANSCLYSINPWVNDTSQTASNLFEEVVLTDSAQNVIYVSHIENDLRGYRNDSATFDFEMIVAENGSPAATATSYYFYVELS